MIVDPPDPPTGHVTGAVATTRATIGGYLLERVVGSGSMGVVWAGSDRDRRRSVAIKLLRSGGDSEARSQLRQSARLAMSVRHRNVVPVLEVGSDAHRDFIVSELVDGVCLLDWLATRPAQREVVAAMLAAGQGLVAAHHVGVVHRHFTLQNVLRGRDGRIWLTDLSLARGQLDPGRDRSMSSVVVAEGRGLASGKPPPRRQHHVLDASLTQHGVFIGTPGYMAPELFRGRSADARSDQFSFCVAIWEALDGQRPFQAESLEQLEGEIRNGNASVSTAISPRLRSVLLRGLDPDPDRRWPDVATLLVEIERVARPGRGSHLLLAASALAVGVAAALAMVVARDSSPSAPIELRMQPTSIATDRCDEAAPAFATIWSEDRRARLLSAIRAGSAKAAIENVVEQMRKRWTVAYAEACAAQDDVGSRRYRECLLSARDQAGAILTTLETAGDGNGDRALRNLLPAIDACRPARP